MLSYVQERRFWQHSSAEHGAITTTANSPATRDTLVQALSIGKEEGLGATGLSYPSASQGPVDDTAAASTSPDTQEGSGRQALPAQGHSPLLDGLYCPITHELMLDPVMTDDGQTYERKAIMKWFAGGQETSPATGAKLASKTLVPNVTLRLVLKTYLKSSIGHQAR